MEDSAKASDGFGATLVATDCVLDQMQWAGTFRFVCNDADGNVLWIDEASNLLTTVGKSQLLNTGYGGTTVYMGLISAASFSTLVAGDTALSHAGWLEEWRLCLPISQIPR